MAQEDFDELLERIPGIADAVNQFESEAVQADAFKALLDVWQGRERRGAKSNLSAKTKQAEAGSEGDKESRKKGAQKSAGGGRKTPAVSAVKDLNLRPNGKQSFVDFVADKEPSTNYERCLVSVYYLSEVLGLDEVGANHVYTCFKAHKNWRNPADLRNTLAKTASRKNWLDTSNMEAIKLTPQGMNAVEHDLPRDASK